MNLLQLDLRRLDEVPLPERTESGECTELDDRLVPVLYQRNALARRYRLFVDRAGRPRVTIPRRGTLRDAQRFAEKHRTWLVQQLRRFETRRAQAPGWHPGTEILFRGCPTVLKLVADGPTAYIRLGCERISLPSGFDSRAADLRVVVELHLRRLADAELPQRVRELAALHQSAVQKVSVRNQRSRWGSCSRRGTVSLNWRLVQVPREVCDYIILHELMHLREMNHSRRFWSHVGEACPGYKQCEAWLRRHSPLLL